MVTGDGGSRGDEVREHAMLVMRSMIMLGNGSHLVKRRRRSRNVLRRGTCICVGVHCIVGVERRTVRERRVVVVAVEHGGEA